MPSARSSTAAAPPAPRKESAPLAAAREAEQDDAKVVTLIQQKGGAGKSTDAVNLAAVSGESNPPEHPDAPCPVVALGIDPQGSLEKWARKVPEDRLPFDYVVTRGRLGELPQLVKDPSVRRIYADTPGFLELDPDAELDALDPLGTGPAGDALRELLEYTDLALVPVVPVESLTWGPAEYTIERILRPRGVKFRVVINDWNSGADRSGADLKEMQEWCDVRGYPYLRPAIRHYKLHAKAPEQGLTVIQYAESGTALRAREDFYKLALAVEGAL